MHMKLLLLFSATLLSIFPGLALGQEPDTQTIDTGTTAWMLTSTALVVFMVPGLALFYGGMVRSKNVLNMLMMNVYCIGIVPIVWVLVAYSLGNSPDGDGFLGGDWIGNLDAVGLKGLSGDTESLVFVAFLMTFACPCAAIFTCCQVGISGEVVRNMLVAILVATLRVRFIHIYYYQYIPLVRLLWYVFIDSRRRTPVLRTTDNHFLLLMYASS